MAVYYSSGAFTPRWPAHFPTLKGRILEVAELLTTILQDLLFY